MSITVSIDRLVNTTDFYNDFLDHQTICGKSAATIRAYAADVRAFASWFANVNGQPFHPSLITSIDLRAYRAHAIAGAMSPATYNRRRITLRILCQWAQAAGHLSYDPSENIEEWIQQELPPRWLEKTDLARYQRQVERRIHAANTTDRRQAAIRDQALIAVMLHTGLRENEAAQLNWRHIVIGDKSGRIEVKNGKGEKARQIPLNRESRRALTLWMDEQPPKNLDAPVFTGKRSARLSTRQIQRIVKSIAVEAGLVITITPHDLRHSFAKRSLDRGAPLTVVSKLLGHSRLETTARYVQPGWADYEKAVED